MSSEAIQNNQPLQRSSAILSAAVISGAVLRLLLLGSKSLWLDESISLLVAKAGLDPLITGMAPYDHPPLYFLILRSWLPLGESETVLRFPSVLAGVLIIVFVYLLARVLAGKGVALSAAWLSATAPLLIWYSQEVRSYSLLVLLGLVATFAFVKLVQRPGVGWWLLYFIAMTAALYTHYVAFALFFVQALLVLVMMLGTRLSTRVILAWILAWAAVLIAYIPWARTPAAGLFIDDLSGTREYIANRLLATLNVDYLPLLLAGIIGLIILLIAASIVLSPRADKVRRFVSALRENKIFQGLLLLSFLALLVVSVVPRGYSVKRIMLIFLPLVLISYAWFWPWAREKRTVLASMILLSLLASLINIIAVPKTQWRETVAYLTDHGQPSDVVLLLPTYMDWPFDYYDQGEFQTTRVRPAEAEEKLPELAETSGRIWLISHLRDIGDSKGVLRGWLKQHGRIEDDVSFYNIQTELYVLDRDDDG